jgi:predicted dehydrogenase
MSTVESPDTRPRFPDERGGVAILGAGAIARSAHLPAYEEHGVGVVGAWSRSPDAREALSGLVPRVYDDPYELLEDPAVRIVDVATPTSVRVGWIEAAVEAGKHVLAQKPLTDDPAGLERLQAVLDRADAAGIRVAANQNGRWAPPWRATTELLRRGAIGDVVGVTHLHDKPLPPLVGTPFDLLEHMLLADYLNHWVDITHSWLEPARVTDVRATDSRVPGQPPESRNPWSATVSMSTDTGATALLRVVGDAVATEPPCTVWVHGTEGTLRGSVLLGSDRLSVDRDGVTRDLLLEGAWFVDGFAATMGELMCAVAEDRQPENSARHALTTVRIVLAAVESARSGGGPVPVGRPGGTP